MRILVDTQCWLWLNAEPERLSATTRSLVTASDSRLLLSAASAWEIAIKYALGKLPLPQPPARYVPASIRALRAEALPIEVAHALRVATLPMHHRDPFDRILIAQALVEKLTLLTSDPQLEHYGATLMAP